MRVLPSLFVAVLGLLFSLFFVADVDLRAAYVTHGCRVSRGDVFYFTSGCVGSEMRKSEVTYVM